MKKILVRADDSSVEVWKKVAKGGGESLNEWVCRVLDEVVGLREAGVGNLAERLDRPKRSAGKGGGKKEPVEKKRHGFMEGYQAVSEGPSRERLAEIAEEERLEREKERGELPLVEECIGCGGREGVVREGEELIFGGKRGWVCGGCLRPEERGIEDAVRESMEGDRRLGMSHSTAAKQVEYVLERGRKFEPKDESAGPIPEPAATGVFEMCHECGRAFQGEGKVCGDCRVDEQEVMAVVEQGPEMPEAVEVRKRLEELVGRPAIIPEEKQKEIVEMMAPELDALATPVDRDWEEGF